MAKVKLDELDEIFGGDIINPSKENSKVDTFYDIGNYALNYIMSKNLKGGVPAGRVTGLEGLGSTGKSLLALSMLRDPKIDLAIIIETEGGGSSQELMEFAGVDLSKVRILKAHTFTSYKIAKKTGKREEVADKDVPAKSETADYIYVKGATLQIKQLMDTFILSNTLKNKKVVIILDSIANIQSVREMNGTQDMGARAKDIGVFFRTFDNTIEKTKVAFVYTNKLYQNFGNIYDPYVAVGGENVFYNSSLIVRLSNTAESDDISDKEKKADKANKNTSLGTQYSTLKGFVRKSRFGTKFRTAQFMIDSQLGVTRYSGLFKLLKDFSIIQGSTWYTMESIWGDKKFHKKDFIKLFREDEENNIIKLQEILDSTELKMKEEKAEEMVNGEADMNDSEDFQEETSILDDLTEVDEDEISRQVIQDVEA
jgi:RecA/RadA recombinase